MDLLARTYLSPDELVSRPVPNNDNGSGSKIKVGSLFVDVQAVTNDANDWITLPALADVPVGETIVIACNAGTNFELRTPNASNEKINNVDCDGTNEFTCTDTDTVVVKKVSATDGWIAASVGIDGGPTYAGPITTASTITATGAINTDSTTDSTSGTTGSLQTDGGLGVAKAAYVGTTVTAGTGFVATAQSVTPNNDNGSGSTILPGVNAVDVGAVTNDANDWITLPSLSAVQVGHTIKIACNAGGAFELRTPTTSNEKINGVDSDGSQEYLCTDTEMITVTKVSDTDGWVATAQTALGAIATAVIPD